MQKYLYRDKVYEIQSCTLNDIPSHLEKVLSYYPLESVSTQEQRMANAIYNGTAYKLVDSDSETQVFIYYEQIKDQEVIGVAMWWSDVKLFAIASMWFRAYTFNQYIHIYPFGGKYIPFEFVVSEESIRTRHYNKDKPFTVDLFGAKFQGIVDLYESMNVEEI